MKYGKAFTGLRFQVVLIILVSMSVMLVFQVISMGRFIAFNNQQRREYITATNENIASSLRTMETNIRSMANYIASFESFKALYFSGRSLGRDTADVVSAAFQTVRFIANYYPIVFDVVVVGLNSIPSSYYMGYGYGFMELMEPEYDFNDPNAVESRFFYFEGMDYFVFVTPISDTYSTIGAARKAASCIFICNMDYIRELVHIGAGDSTVNFSIYDKYGMLIASSGHEDTGTGKLMVSVSMADTMGLNVIASAGPAGIVPGRDETTRFIRSFFIFSVFLLIAITIMTILLLRNRIVRPIANLVSSLDAGTDKPLHTRLEHSHIEEIDHIVEGVNTLLDEIEESAQKSMKTQEKLYEMELRKNEAEIYALQSQINPHFLNNTLQCIRGIAISKGVIEIADISLAMSELFRYAMNYEDHVFVREELDIVRHYIVITNIRFRNRFRFSFDVDPEVYNCHMCRMILQPLVENAIRHGISGLEEGGVVEITGRMEKGIIRFEVMDNGPGFGEEQLAVLRRELSYSFTETKEHHKGGSFGLYNINRRLKLNYGETYGLEIGRKDHKTLVSLSFPDSL